MNKEIEETFIKAIQDGIRTGVIDRLKKDYNNPIDSVFKSVIEEIKIELTTILKDSIKECFNNTQFIQDIKDGVRKKLANILVQRFGGELEKQVNVLKSDPTTRARIVVAIEDIIKSKNI